MLSATSLGAQITIQENDIFISGTSSEYNYQENPTISINNTGANVLYDFSQLVSEISYQYEIVLPTTSPFGPILPGNRVFVFNGGDNGATYYTKFDGMLLSNGNVMPDESNPENIFIEKHEPAERVASFPLQYGQQYSGTTANENTFYAGFDFGDGMIVDSIRIRRVREYDYHFDGWGTLKTPVNEYDVLRQKSHSKVNDAVDLFLRDTQEWIVDENGTENEFIEYTFWATGQSFPVVKIFDDFADGVLEEVTWISELPNSSNNLASNDFEIDVFPNPSKGIITISSKSNLINNWILFDLNGKLIKKGSLNSNQETINLSELPKGIYNLKLVSNRNVLNKKIVITQ